MQTDAARGLTQQHSHSGALVDAAATALRQLQELDAQSSATGAAGCEIGTIEAVLDSVADLAATLGIDVDSVFDLLEESGTSAEGTQDAATQPFELGGSANHSRGSTGSATASHIFAKEATDTVESSLLIPVCFVCPPTPRADDVCSVANDDDRRNDLPPSDGISCRQSRRVSMVTILEEEALSPDNGSPLQRSRRASFTFPDDRDGSPGCRSCLSMVSHFATPPEIDLAASPCSFALDASPPPAALCTLPSLGLPTSEGATPGSAGLSHVGKLNARWVITAANTPVPFTPMPV